MGTVIPLQQPLGRTEQSAMPTMIPKRSITCAIRSEPKGSRGSTATSNAYKKKLARKSPSQLSRYYLYVNLSVAVMMTMVAVILVRPVIIRRPRIVAI
jgi:hypothetical protein